MELTRDMLTDLRPARRLSGEYDATVANARRKQRVRVLKSEDDHLIPADRKALLVASRDIHRNFSLAAWAIRKHLDYTSTFTFQSRTGDDALDLEIERRIAWWSRAENCDLRAMHDLDRLVRLLEERRTVDGDVFVLKLSDGRLQPIEGDRVGNPNSAAPIDFSSGDWVHGVQVSPGGRPLRYCVCRRTRWGGLVFSKIVPAWNIESHGFYDRLDQVRGITPLAAAVNSFRDVYEGCDYALAKMKMSQMFGLVFYRDYDGGGIGQSVKRDDGSEGYDVDLGRGPMVLDLDPADRAEFLESKSPSTEFQAHAQTMIGLALKSLDIPFSFFDESFTNYSGARQALLQYEQSAAAKRADVQRLLDRLTLWRLGLFVADGDLKLPGKLTLDNLAWEWVPAGLPWIDPLKEVNADVAAVNNILSSRTEVLKQRGRDFKDVVDELAKENEYMAAKGVTALPGFAPVPAETAEGDKSGDKKR